MLHINHSVKPPPGDKPHLPAATIHYGHIHHTVRSRQATLHIGPVATLLGRKRFDVQPAQRLRHLVTASQHPCMKPVIRYRTTQQRIHHYRQHQRSCRIGHPVPHITTAAYIHNLLQQFHRSAKQARKHHGHTQTAHINTQTAPRNIPPKRYGNSSEHQEMHHLVGMRKDIHAHIRTRRHKSEIQHRRDYGRRGKIQWYAVNTAYQ